MIYLAWESLLTTALEDGSKAQDLGQVHISILSVFNDFPWHISPSDLLTKPTIESDLSAAASRTSKLTYQDISSFSYSVEVIPGLYADTVLKHLNNQSPSKDSSISPVITRALLSTILVTIPNSSPITPSSTTTSLINLLHTYATNESCMHKPLDQHMRDIVRSFHDLEVLANLRWSKPGISLGLPLHLYVLQIIVQNLPPTPERPVN
jgi:hypothetical protein